MNASLWYNEACKRWRWTLLHPDGVRMESGDAIELDDALRDIKNTIGWIKGTQKE